MRRIAQYLGCLGMAAGVAMQAVFTSPSLAAELPAASQPAQKAFDDYLVQASVLLKQRKLDEALAAVQAAQKLDSKRFEAPAAAALILHVAQRKAEAKTACEEAILLGPVSQSAKVERLVILLDPKSAIAARTTAESNVRDKLTAESRRQSDTLTLMTDEAITLSPPVKKENLQAGSITTDGTATESQKDLAGLQGLWGSYLGWFYHSNGKEIGFQPRDSLRRTHRIKGNKWTELDENEKHTGMEKTITFNASKVPKQMQLTYTRKREGGKSEEQVTERILYVLEGDRLTLHRALEGEAKPTVITLLEAGKPVKGLDGEVHYFQRMKDE